MLGIIAGGLIIVACFNLIVDPYNCFGLLGGTQLSRSRTGIATPIGKGQMLATRDWDIVLLGTSRVEQGLDPSHPAFEGQRVYNAGLAGADFPELDHAARLAMRRGTLKRLILCVEFFCFDPDWHATDDAERSLINPQVNRFEYYATSLLSLSTTKQSRDTLIFAKAGYNSTHYPLGMRVAHPSEAGQSPHIWITSGYLRLTLPNGIEKSDRWPLDESRFEALSQLLADSSRAGVHVDLVQLPMHAAALEGYFAIDRWPFYERWVQTLTQVVARHNERFPQAPATLWDFCNYDSLTTDPAINKSVWFYDPFHIRIPLGDLVIDRIMNHAPPVETDLSDFGLILTEANLPLHLARLRRDHETYYANNPIVKQFHVALAARPCYGTSAPEFYDPPGTGPPTIRPTWPVPVVNVATSRGPVTVEPLLPWASGGSIRPEILIGRFMAVPVPAKRSLLIGTVAVSVPGLPSASAIWAEIVMDDEVIEAEPSPV